MTVTLLHQLVIAVALGLLVGLQRERAMVGIAGIRTFPLITLSGVVSGVLGAMYGGWPVAAGVIVIGLLTVIANYIQLRNGGVTEGMTTEVAAVLMFLVGALLTTEYVLEAVVSGAAVALLLHWKAPLHAFADRMGQDDFQALMQLTLLAFVILPVLPNQAYGPYAVLNPFKMWLMVVLIVGISMAGYVAFKLFGEKAGAVMAGVLGGLISSTATTVSYAGRSAEAPARSPAAALVIVLASTIVFARVMVELAVVSPSVLGETLPPLVAMMAIMIVIAGALYAKGVASATAEMEDQDPPSDLKSAIVFGLLYGAVLLAVAFAEDQFGTSGLYVVAAISGLTDMDAITLSTAQLMQENGLDPSVGWRAILIGGLSNTLFKGGVVVALGAPALRRKIVVAFGAALVGGGALLVFWP